MFAAVASRTALNCNRSLLLRSFATVGSQIPSVELHRSIHAHLIHKANSRLQGETRRSPCQGGDPNSEFTKALVRSLGFLVVTEFHDLELTHPGPVSVLGPGRCKRFAMHVVDGEIKAINVSEGPDDPAGDKDPSCSMADGILATM
eukprot:scaffold6987_cov72-Cyclotella_meneghiniana.AAC.1